MFSFVLTIYQVRTNFEQGMQVPCSHFNFCPPVSLSMCGYCLQWQGSNSRFPFFSISFIFIRIILQKKSSFLLFIQLSLQHIIMYDFCILWTIFHFYVVIIVVQLEHQNFYYSGLSVWLTCFFGMLHLFVLFAYLFAWSSS